MQPNYIPQEPMFELDWSDRKAIQKLYGKTVLEDHLQSSQSTLSISKHDRTPLTPYGEAGPQRAQIVQVPTAPDGSCCLAL